MPMTVTSVQSAPPLTPRSNIAATGKHDNHG